MACPCENNSTPYYNDCSSSSTPATTGCLTLLNTSCITYDGDDIPDNEGLTLNEVLNNIYNTVYGGSTWGAWNVACVDDSTTVNSLQTFVQAISAQYCATKASLSTNTTNITTITNQVNGILNPTITGCAYLGASTAYDTYAEAMQLFSSKLCDLNNRLLFTGVTWNACYNVTVPPTTIPAALNLINAQICAIKTTVDGITTSTDKYARTSSLDTVSGYLLDKLKFNPCFQVNEYDKGGSNYAIGIGLATNLKNYTFDTTQFDSTATGSGGLGACVENYTISLNTDFLDSLAGDTVNCTSISAVFTTGTSPTTGIYGSKSGGCAKFDNCQILEYLSTGLTTGKYVLSIDTAQTATCDKYKFEALSIPVTSNACTVLGWTGLSGTMVAAGSATNGAITWTATPGGTNSVSYTVIASTYPKYKWNLDGSLTLKGAVSTAFHGTAGTGTNRIYTYDIVLGTVNNPCGNPLEAQEHFAMYKQLNDLINPGSLVGSASALVSISESGVLKIRIYVAADANVHDWSLIIPLSGITFNF